MAQIVGHAVFAIICLLGATGEAATYYVKKTGSDGNSCATAQSASTPKLTINSALACLTAAGDVLRIGQGTYVESIIYTALPVSGTAANPITITQIVGENRPLIQPNTGCYGLLMHNSRDYIIYDGLDFSGINMNSCALSSAGSLVSAGSDDGPYGTIIRHTIINDSPGSNIINGDNLLVEDFEVNGTGWRAHAIGYGPGSNGIYGAKLRNSIIRRGTGTGNQCGFIRVYNSGTSVGADNNLIDKVYGFTNGNGKGLGGASTCSAATFIIGDKNNTLQNSIGDDGGLRCIWLYPSGLGTSGNNFYNNTCTRHTYNLVFHNNTTILNTKVINNIFLDSTTANISGTGSGTTFTTNISSGTLSTYTPGAGIFTHRAGSPAIDAGTNVGLACNGQCDIGAFEAFTFASCEVPNGAANTIQLTFTSNAHLLGDVLTTFTARRNGSNNALTGAASKIGDTIISLPLTTTYAGGDTPDISWASGGLTDNARIGGTLNQPFLQTLTNQSCTNNAGSAPAYVLSQERVQFRGVYGPENTTDIRGPDNPASYEVVVNGAARIRFAVKDAVANAPPFALYLRYSHDGGPYTVVPEVFGADHIAFCGTRYPDLGVSNGTGTTSQLVTSGTFIPAAVVLNANAIPTITGLNIGYKTEPEYVPCWDESASGTYTFRLYEQSGAPLGDYVVTPSVVIVPPRGGGMP